MDYNGKLKAYGEKVVGRAEMLASMDCLMHHLSENDDFEQWRMNALPRSLWWHVLDFDPIASSARFDEYANAVKDMSDNEFNCIVRTFAEIVRRQCFMKVFNPDSFSAGKVIYG